MVDLRFWPLFVKREILYEVNIPATKAQLQTVMREPNKYLRNNPLIYYVQQDADEKGEPITSDMKYESRLWGFPVDPDVDRKPAWFTIRETVRSSGGITGSKDFETEFRVLYWTTENGAGLFMDGGAWTTVHTTVTVEESSEGGSLLRKHQRYKGLFFLMPFALATSRRNHPSIMDALTRKALGQDS